MTELIGERMGDRSKSEYPLYLNIVLGEENFPKLFPLLQRGFVVKGASGCSVRQLLVDRLCLPSEYVDNRVQTVFLNGKAVDDLNGSMVSDGATVALSAAMPGLVGATFRKGGYFAGFRSQVTHGCGEETNACQGGSLTLKLFNIVLDELAPAFLQKGILIPGAHFREWQDGQSPQFWKTCKALVVNGTPVAPENLGGFEWSDEPILLKVVAGMQS
jgi:hypothetical protein